MRMKHDWALDAPVTSIRDVALNAGQRLRFANHRRSLAAKVTIWRPHSLLVRLDQYRGMAVDQGTDVL